MDFFTALILLVAGFIAGAVNSVAGGGTFFSFAALLMAGLPPITANATSAVAVVPGSISALAAYGRESIFLWHQFKWLAVLSFVASLIGALLLLKLGNEDFKALIPYLLFAATMLFAFGDRLRAGVDKLAFITGPLRKLYVGAVQFMASLYGGFFGAGMGILMLSALSLTFGRDYHKINIIKNALSVLIQFACISVFVAADVIHWGFAGFMMVASIAGGYSGVFIAKRVNVVWVRRFVLITGVSLSAFYFFT